MKRSGYIRKTRLPIEDQRLIKRIGRKIHRELHRRAETSETFSKQVAVARSTLREIIAGRSDARILTLRAIALGLGYSSVKDFLSDIESIP